jgi:predicted phage terminase large subunit-like protein
MFWDRAWITTRLERPPAMPMARLRYWDLGGTEDSRGRDPAYTAGVLMSVQRDGLVIVEDVARCRKDPGGVEEFFGEIAGADAARFGGVEQFIEQDPGQAGKFEISAFQTRFPQHDIGCWRPTGDKVTRFKPFSAMASRGKVGMVIGRWNGAYHDELEGFPPLTRKGKADQADASSGAFEQLQRGVHVPARAGGVREMRRAVGGF